MLLILESNQLLDYIDLDALLRKRNFFNQQNEIEKVIEFGCGTGWLTNTISHYYNKKVTAVDFTKKAINIAAEVNNKFLFIFSPFLLGHIKSFFADSSRHPDFTSNLVRQVSKIKKSIHSICRGIYISSPCTSFSINNNSN